MVTSLDRDADEGAVRLSVASPVRAPDIRSEARVPRRTSPRLYGSWSCPSPVSRSTPTLSRALMIPASQGPLTSG